MLWVDIKYANLIGSKLTKFRVLKEHPYVANYRCPFCDDINEVKRSRGYLLERDNTVFAYCHNCGYSTHLRYVLEKIDSSLYQEYKVESLKELWGKPKPQRELNITFATPVFDRKIKLGDPLSKEVNSLGYEYATSRKIPTSFFDSLFFTEDVNTLTEQIDGYKDTKFNKDPALIIPFFTNDRAFSYISCRFISSKSFRYLVLEINKDNPKIWGIEFVDWSQPVFVFEGPIDAMCVPNAISMAGISSNNSISYIKKNNSNSCFVYDKDGLYNREVTKQIKKRIDEGFKVVIFDRNFPGKDVNEVISHDKMCYDDVVRYLRDRTFSGLRAKAELSCQIKYFKGSK